MADIRVEYVEHMGDCLKVCRMAKDSFGRTTEWEYHGKDLFGNDVNILSQKDQKLLRMLARGMGEKEHFDLIDRIIENDSYVDVEDMMWRFRHTTPHLAPFGHNFMSVKFQAPIFVMRQIMKHEYLRVSELSMRYVRGMPEYFRPDTWRAAADDVKQGSRGEYGDQEDLNEYLVESYLEDKAEYEAQIRGKLAPEQARMFLRQCAMTQGHMSGSMDAWAGLVQKRLDGHAQEETRQFAKLVDGIATKLWPYSWEALMEGVQGRH